MGPGRPGPLDKTALLTVVDDFVAVCPGAVSACTSDELSNCLGGQRRKREPGSLPPTDPDEFDRFCQLVSSHSDTQCVSTSMICSVL